MRRLVSLFFRVGEGLMEAEGFKVLQIAQLTLLYYTAFYLLVFLSEGM